MDKHGLIDCTGRRILFLLHLCVHFRPRRKYKDFEQISSASGIGFWSGFRVFGEEEPSYLMYSLFFFLIGFQIPNTLGENRVQISLKGEFHE